MSVIFAPKPVTDGDDGNSQTGSIGSPAVSFRGGFGAMGRGVLISAQGTNPGAPPSAVPIALAEVIGGAGTVGVAFSVTLESVGGTGPYSYSLLSGSLPPGLSLASGIISGTPTAAGTYTFTIEVTDANGAVDSTTFQIVIAAPAGGGNYSYAA